MKDSVFLDTGIFIAMLNRRDQWHTSAVALFALKGPRWCTSVLVVSESYSWFLHRFGEETARKFRLLLASLEGLTLLHTSQSHHAAIGRMLDRLRGAQLTYVDASSLCFMEQHRIRRVWATDHHLGLTGAEVAPIS
jgi:predicted nucleic acid-binding protein